MTAKNSRRTSTKARGMEASSQRRQRPADPDLLLRALMLKAATIEFRHEPAFDEPDAQRQFSLEHCHHLLDPQLPGHRWENTDRLSPILARMCTTPLLSAQEEALLFRTMNYLKWRASTLRDRLDPHRASLAQVETMERLLADALLIRNQLIAANTRLVVSIAKGYVDPHNRFDDLISEGLWSLIRAVEKFSVGLGNRFSTYATRTVRNNLHHALGKDYRDRKRAAPAEAFDDLCDPRDGDSAVSQMQKLRLRVGELVDRLSEPHRTVIVARFGLAGAGKPKTYEKISAELGLPKDRVRRLHAESLRCLGEWMRPDIETDGETHTG